MVYFNLWNILKYTLYFNNYWKTLIIIGKILIILRGLHNKDNNNKDPIDWKLCYKSLFDNFIFF